MKSVPKPSLTPAQTQAPDLSSTEFRAHASELIDWLIAYLDHPERYKVLSDVKPGDVKRKLPHSPPEQPEPFEGILKDLDSIIAPGLTHWNHPGFMAYFSNTASRPGILGELLSAGLNTNSMLWRTGPASVELEEVVTDWLRQLMGLPSEFFGLIHDTASVSTLVALAAARERLGLGVREDGMAGRSDLPKLRIYTSEHAHSSVEKAAIVLGLGQRGVLKIGVDDRFRMRSDLLREKIKSDLAEGVKPMAVVATVGTTSTTSVDPVSEIAQLCTQYRVWLHVDAAYAGSAALIPEFRWLVDGCQYADSFLVNPHKWLFVPMDCSVLYCRQPETLYRALSLVPEYLRSHEESVRNPMDYGISMGRRFRALKLWMVIRMFGAEGIRQRLRYHIKIAQTFRSHIEQHPDFELMAPSPLSVVCFRYRPASAKLTEETIDRMNERLEEGVNKTGEVFLSQTKLNGRVVLRLAVGNLETSEQHISRAWELLKMQAQML